MDILTQKQNKKYSGYLSRYSGIPFYYNTVDDKYVYGLTKWLDTSSAYIIHKVKETDDLDYLSNYYYGRPDYFWVIADFNRIEDAFIKLSDYYTELKIPSISNLTYKD